MPLDAGPRFLLLVPTPPEPEVFPAYKEAFGSTITDVMKEVSLQREAGEATPVLEIALACPQLVEGLNSARAGLYAQVQKQIALIYELVVVLANKDSINVEDDDGIDVRVLPVAWSTKQATVSAPGYGPILTLTSLARSNRTWQYAFGVESEEGEAMVRDFVSAKSNAGADLPARTTSTKQGSGPWHYDVAVGGTFDHMHIGHKLLLTMTLFAADTLESGASPRVTIGITGDELLKNKKFAEVLESWETRQKKIEDFCDSLLDFTSWPAHKAVDVRNEPGPNGRSVNLVYGNGLEVRCTQIQDPFGPTITDKSITALVISGETRSGGKAVNDKRREKGWPELEVFEVDVLDADEDGVESVGFEAKLSSTAIRQKLAARNG